MSLIINHIFNGPIHFYLIIIFNVFYCLADFYYKVPVSIIVRSCYFGKWLILKKRKTECLPLNKLSYGYLPLRMGFARQFLIILFAGKITHSQILRITNAITIKPMKVTTTQTVYVQTRQSINATHATTKITGIEIHSAHIRSTNGQKRR